jgi:hypothetical protein
MWGKWGSGTAKAEGIKGTNHIVILDLNPVNSSNKQG